MTAVLEKRPTLYRLFDSDGQLLYVGCSTYPTLRISAHAGREWWSGVARATFEHYDSHDEALEAERRAIATEDPKHNIMGKPWSAERRAHHAQVIQKGREKRRRQQEKWLAEQADLVSVRGLHCANCDWAAGRIRRGQVISETECPKCGCPTLTVDREVAA